MLIDTFASDWLEYLDRKRMQIDPQTHLYLLLDGVCVPGLHRLLGVAPMSLLFSFLPGCDETSKDVSPCLIRYDPHDRRLKSHLQRCNGWPMVSAIHTRESLDALARRLAAWCVVEADGQRFHLRFADTRRLPAIFDALHPGQQQALSGPALSWAYVSRRGTWNDLELRSMDTDVVMSPELDAHQFDILVSDSVEDELLALLRRRGCQDTRSPSQSHERVATAVAAARKAGLGEDLLLAWCEWCWKQSEIANMGEALVRIERWRESIAE